MCEYTSAFSEFFQRSPGIVSERVMYIPYHEIFGESFTLSILLMAYTSLILLKNRPDPLGCRRITVGKGHLHLQCPVVS